MLPGTNLSFSAVFAQSAVLQGGTFFTRSGQEGARGVPHVLHGLTSVVNMFSKFVPAPPAAIYRVYLGLHST